jgi:hypothetical protein
MYGALYFLWLSTQVLWHAQKYFARSVGVFVGNVNTHQTTRRHMPEEKHIYIWCRDNFVSYAVAYLVEALRYMPEGRGFDSR